MIEGAPSFRGVCEKVGFDVVFLFLPGEPFTGQPDDGDVGDDARSRRSFTCTPAASTSLDFQYGN
jgi:hypothetical protein